tara:strand:- start:63 stop:476 length:414 start_codon:yes stop_codon:yes gene_type:complete
MNLYITNRDVEIKGFNSINVTKGTVDFSEIPKNSCTQIVIENALEHVENIFDFFKSCVQLLRMGAAIKIIGIDLRSICLSYVNGSLDTKTFNDTFIANTKGLLSTNDMLDFLKHNNMHIEKCDLLNESMYEIIAHRR